MTNKPIKSVKNYSVAELGAAYYHQLGEARYNALVAELKTKKGENNAADTLDTALSRLAKRDQENHLSSYRDTDALVTAIWAAVDDLFLERKESFEMQEKLVAERARKAKEDLFYR